MVRKETSHSSAQLCGSCYFKILLYLVHLNKIFNNLHIYLEVILQRAGFHCHYVTNFSHVQAKKESEETRQKKWEEEFERQQEKLRQEAAEELKVGFHTL